MGHKSALKHSPHATKDHYHLVLFFTAFVVLHNFRYRERGNIEAQYFNIQARLKANGQKMYLPPEGRLIHDIESAWIMLEKCEHGREVALKDELIRWGCSPVSHQCWSAGS